jgi:hypothetical protein
MEPVKHASAALLLHVVGWQAGQDHREIAPGLRLAKTTGSAVERLYHHLCNVDGIDDAEPYAFTSHAEFTPSTAMPHFLNVGDPYSSVDQFCDVVALSSKRPLPMTRVIWSVDGFETAQSTERIHVSAGVGSEHLLPDYPTLTDGLLDRISAIWHNLHPEGVGADRPRRLETALTYFGYAWRSWYLEQVCLNLSIVIEVLFAPHSHSETTHQLAFNFAHFCGGSRDQREVRFELVKAFYRLRSAVVHGGSPHSDKLYDIVPRMFVQVAEVLAGILASADLTSRFSSDSRRRSLLSDLTFWEANFAPLDSAP